MTLPPVVSDPKWCPEHRDEEVGGILPHDWEPVLPAGYRRCRYCGGRKP